MLLQEKNKLTPRGRAGGAGDLNSIKNFLVARDFNDALVNSTVDLVTAKMTIWGDPITLLTVVWVIIML